MNRRYKLPIIVALFHLPILFIQIHHKASKKPPHKKITINTINLLEEKPISSYQKEEPKAPIQPKRTIQKKVVKVKPKKKQQKKIAKKKPVSKKKIQKAIKKSLNKPKIASKTPSKKSKGKVAKNKKTTKKDAGKEQSEYNLYLSKVFDLLSESLTLPETGKVKLKLTVRPNGKVIKIVSLLSESADNLAYLEEKISDLSFPAYTKQEDRTFTIVFSDEK